MAIGNQIPNGNCDLLVINPIYINNNKIKSKFINLNLQ